mmetsp:Transcript_37387/g.98899  ORF Transcript_37387/g.98899 Transcript_37387/m.98899 type:complete len:156 (-) Transcript_37387:287-754(-)
MPMHEKERCTSCGVWKMKVGECYLCVTMPNRHQVATKHVRMKAAERYAEPYGMQPSPQHMRERCASCGVWKEKQNGCYFCSTLPNRAQAARAREKAASMVKVKPSTPLHLKERCTSCGVWKDKRRECYHCTTLPTRKQMAITSPAPNRHSYDLSL